MKITNISHEPPSMMQHFDSLLLSHPAPKFRDSSDNFRNIFKWIARKHSKKAVKNKISNEKYIKFEMEYLELYGRIKKKEEEREAEKNHFTQGFGYCIRSTDKKNESIYRRLRYK